MKDPDDSAKSAVSATQVMLVAHDPARADVIRSGLGDGMSVTCISESDCPDVVVSVIATQPDILIWDVKDEASGLTAIEQISATNPLPILLFSSGSEASRAKLALQAGVSAYIVDDLQPQRIPILMEIALERFRMTDALHQELRRSKEELAARKSIERAKGLLMERRNLTEREAYESMRRMAMAQGKTVRAIAETILSISDILP